MLSINTKTPHNTQNMSEAHTVNVAIVGASGFSGEELIHRLLQHPHAKLVAVTSRQYAGRTLTQIFPRFAGYPVADTLQFIEPNTASLAEAAEVVFLALPHGVAAEFAKPLVDAKVKVIDLSADFRLNDPAVYEEFYNSTHPAPALLEKSIYGMPDCTVKPSAIRNSSPHPDVIPPVFCCPRYPCFVPSLSSPLAS